MTDHHSNEDHTSHGQVTIDPVAEGLDLDVLPGGAKAAIEAIMMVVDEPISELSLAASLVLSADRVRELLEELAAEYREQRRGFELREAAGGWRVYSSAAFADVVGRFMVNGQTAKLSQAALETLAVIAYRQPVARGRVAAIRGVNVDGVVRTLLARGLIGEADTDEATGAIRYKTTSYFLERMGLRSLDDLPHLAPYLPDQTDLDDIASAQ